MAAIATTNEPSSGLLYEELPLDHSKKTLRLFTIKDDGANGTSILRLTMKVFDEGYRPKYTALSYAWGTLDDKCPVSVNSKPLLVTRNLFNFLMTLARQFGKQPGLWFWADQISMHQDDVAERNHQVAQMSNIYLGAESVWVYLGTGLALSQQEFDALLRQETLDIVSIRVFLDIFDRAYWSRLWIVQELGLALETRFWCGNVYSGRFGLLRKCLLLLAREQDVRRCVRQLGTIEAELFQRMVRFYRRGTGESVASLLKRSRVDRHSGDSLLEVVLLFGHNDCSVVLDKVFGLQGLVDDYWHVPVDYTLDLRQVLLNAFETHVAHHMLWQWTFKLWDTPDLDGEAKIIVQLAVKVLNMFAITDIATSNLYMRIWAHVLEMFPSLVNEDRLALYEKQQRAMIIILNRAWQADENGWNDSISAVRGWLAGVMSNEKEWRELRALTSKEWCEPINPDKMDGVYDSDSELDDGHQQWAI